MPEYCWLTGWLGLDGRLDWRSEYRDCFFMEWFLPLAFQSKVVSHTVHCFTETRLRGRSIQPKTFGLWQRSQSLKLGSKAGATSKRATRSTVSRGVSLTGCPVCSAPSRRK